MSAKVGGLVQRIGGKRLKPIPCSGHQNFPKDLRRGEYLCDLLALGCMDQNPKRKVLLLHSIKSFFLTLNVVWSLSTENNHPLMLLGASQGLQKLVSFYWS